MPCIRARWIVIPSALSILAAGCSVSSPGVHGAPGPAGPAGAQGPAGPQGAQGLQGLPGTAGDAGSGGGSGGITISSLAPGNANCPNGGASFTSPDGGVTYVCNGLGVASVALDAGDAHCPYGGSLIGDGGSGIYVCNGAVVTFNGTEFSTHGVYCGVTSAATNGIVTATTGTGQALTGYPAAKYLCQVTCGKPYAHVCEGSELVRTVTAGLKVGATGWYQAGTGLVIPIGAGLLYDDDCGAWTSNGNNTFQGWWTIDPANARPNRPNNVGCDQSWPLLCCE
jgi:hypothetical protein